MLSMIARVDEWYQLTDECSHDAKRYFYEKTKGHKVAMGRNTMELRRHRPFADRENFVFTPFAPHMKVDGYNFLPSLTHWVSEDSDWVNSDEEIFIVGGYSMFRQCYRYAHKMYVIMTASIPKSKMPDPTMIDSKFALQTFPLENWVNHIGMHKAIDPKMDVIFQKVTKDKLLTITEYEAIPTQKLE